MTEEEAIVAAEAEEAIKDKDKSSHRLIGGSNKDEGSDSDSESDSGEQRDSGETYGLSPLHKYDISNNIYNIS